MLGPGALRLGSVRASPLKLMPTYGVAERVFVSGDLDRAFLALAGGTIDGVGLAAMRRRFATLAEGLAVPGRSVTDLAAAMRSAEF